MSPEKFQFKCQLPTIGARWQRCEAFLAIESKRSEWSFAKRQESIFTFRVNFAVKVKNVFGLNKCTFTNIHVSGHFNKIIIRPKCRNELLPLSRQYEWCHFSINFVSREISFEINWSLGNFAFAFACGTAYQSRKRFERKKKLLKYILLKECRKIIKSVKLISDL